jgi:segregation and condensation protein B
VSASPPNMADQVNAVADAIDVAGGTGVDAGLDISEDASPQSSEDGPAPAVPNQAGTTDRSMDQSLITRIVEAALLAANQPLTIAQLRGLFTLDEPAPDGSIEQALTDLRNACAERGVELAETASGYRFQVQADVHAWVARLWNERQTKYTRATLETLAIIAYRQPITRGEIEQIRGVAVSSNIVKALEEREWIRSVGHRDMPGRPELLGTTKTFLDYFGLKSLDQLPPLSELKDFAELDPQMAFADPEGTKAAALAEAMQIADAQAPIAAGIAMDESAGDAANDAGSTEADSTEADSTEVGSADADSYHADANHADANHADANDAGANHDASDDDASDDSMHNDDARDEADDAESREMPHIHDDHGDNAGAASHDHHDSNIALVDDDDSTGA